MTTLIPLNESTRGEAWELRERDHCGDNIFSVDGRRIANTYGDCSQSPYRENALRIASVPQMERELATLRTQLTALRTAAEGAREFIRMCETVGYLQLPEVRTEE